jgi:DNA-binding LacI/PurR family transcriptional regulator
VTEHVQRPTLEQVAALAGTSRATASRVVNQNPKVSPAARRAVERAIQELGYTPNRAARSLVTRRSDSIGLVVTESEERLFGEPFFASLLRGVSDALAETDIQLVLLMSRSNEERSRVERFLSTHVDGVLLVSAHADEPLLERLTSGTIPAVLAGRPLRPTSLPYVDVDNVGGAYEAVRHLVDRGRQRIATIAGPQDMAAGIDRLEGYRKAVEDLPGADETLLAVGDFSTPSGERAAEELLERRPDLDAIFAASDLMAVGALQALKRVGRRVPEDVAVVGFDDSVVATTTNPRLTSVHQPTGDLGRQMIMRLREALDGPSLVPSVTVLPTHLVARDST